VVTGSIELADTWQTTQSVAPEVYQDALVLLWQEILAHAPLASSKFVTITLVPPAAGKIPLKLTMETISALP
jgi:hypothetical protein